MPQLAKVKKMSRFQRDLDIFFTLGEWATRSASRKFRNRARILYMTTLPLAEVRANLSKLVDEAVRTHLRIEVTRQGRRAAVILSADDYDSIIETLDILSDPDLMEDIRQGQADVARGDFHTLDDVTKEMRAKGRLPK
ncbi:type II toxin-antitoxin system Phd/YefM family antitoxin [[Mycobacterium] fortunisiensis]|nr:type II toxin-antitoxin system Phd/YefM family antitoxin [[Mycobacterium] fortunisiensis]